jgi:hypothetical protein
MKLLTAFAILLFLAANAEAQLYPGYPYSQPYYQGLTTQPYYPQPYYPVPFGLPNYSQQDPLAAQHPAVANEFAISSNNEATDTLRRQVQQLTEQVRSRQDEIAATDEQLAQMRSFETPSASTKPAAPGVLVLKNGQVLETRGYAVVGDTLWILTRSGREQMALSNLDVPATQKENLKRGIKFPNLES